MEALAPLPRPLSRDLSPTRKHPSIPSAPGVGSTARTKRSRCVSPHGSAALALDELDSITLLRQVFFSRGVAGRWDTAAWRANELITTPEPAGNHAVVVLVVAASGPALALNNLTSIITKAISKIAASPTATTTAARGRSRRGVRWGCHPITHCCDDLGSGSRPIIHFDARGVLVRRNQSLSIHLLPGRDAHTSRVCRR